MSAMAASHVLRFALELPTHRAEQADEFVTADAIAALTRAAATAGFSAVFVTDHPAPDTRWLEGGGHHALDPFVALSFAAAADPTVKLLTNIYVAAYRNPFLSAKSVQSLDVLSQGRMILGVAAGYLRPEFAALGVDFDGRGALLDESLAVLDAVLTGDDVAWEGTNFVARGVRLRPLPPSGRRPPVWVGGNSKPAIRRAVRFEGWAPFFTGGYAKASRTTAIDTVDELADAITYVRSLRVDASSPFDICVSDAVIGDGSVSVDERLARLRALADAGVTWVGLGLAANSRAEMSQRIDDFGRTVIRAQESPEPLTG
jgi:probable F420-dependent oxidoreductase